MIKYICVLCLGVLCSIAGIQKVEISRLQRMVTQVKYEKNIEIQKRIYAVKHPEYFIPEITTELLSRKDKR